MICVSNVNPINSTKKICLCTRVWACKLFNISAVLLNIVQFIICLRYTCRLTVLNLGINTANNKKKHRSFLFMHVHFLLHSVSVHACIHTFLVHYETKFRPECVSSATKIQWAHLYLKFEIVRRIKNHTHTHTQTTTLFRPVNVLALQTQSYTRWKCLPKRRKKEWKRDKMMWFISNAEKDATMRHSIGEKKKKKKRT